MNLLRSFAAAVRLTLLLGGSAVFSGIAGTAWAHSNEYLETVVGSHGGQVRMVEAYHFEVVVKNGEVRVWVTDHADQPVSTDGASGSVVLVNGAGTVQVKLFPAGDNRLAGKDSRVTQGNDTKMILTVAMKGEKALQARYARAINGTAER